VILLLALLAQGIDASVTIARGEQIFAQSCSGGYCHGAAGAAGRGPRLRGRSLDRPFVLKVTRDGIPNSAMPAWSGRMSDADITAVVDYVMSIAGEEKAAAIPPSAAPHGAEPASPPPFTGPAQAKRGLEIFFDAANDNRCGVCHSLAGRGIAIGPGLEKFGSLPPKELASALRSTRSHQVMTARLKDGDTFPAILVERNAKIVKLYDLTIPPPVVRTFEPADIASLDPDRSWNHEPYIRQYTPEQLADLVAYVRWAVAGDKLEVKPADLK
jgi:mono/diheme cytochrome c family protein